MMTDQQIAETVQRAVAIAEKAVPHVPDNSTQTARTYQITAAMRAAAFTVAVNLIIENEVAG